MLNVSEIWLPDLQQQNYRAVLDAMSRPGTRQTLIIPPHHDEPDGAHIAVLASLLDNSVTLADPNQCINSDNRALLQAELATPDQADFIFCNGDLAPDFEPKLGTLPSPERSATIIIQVQDLNTPNAELSLQLSGPGIKNTVHCTLAGLDSSWLTKREAWISSFPLGVDLLLVDDNSIISLPRTTHVENL